MQIQIPDDLQVKLSSIASALDLSAEDLALLLLRSSTEEIETSLHKALEYVLSKNKELYERLAR